MAAGYLQTVAPLHQQLHQLISCSQRLPQPALVGPAYAADEPVAAAAAASQDPDGPSVAPELPAGDGFVLAPELAGAVVQIVAGCEASASVELSQVDSDAAAAVGQITPQGFAGLVLPGLQVLDEDAVDGQQAAVVAQDVVSE
jgi:hypothetical protein